MELHPAVTQLLTRRQWAQRTPEWYAIRRELLTASDVASSLGIKPFASYKGDIRADTLIKKLENAPFGNMFVAHGQKYEDEARDKMAAALGVTCLDFGLLVHPEHPWLAASPDGVTTSGFAVEIKCPLKREIVPGHIPHHYYPQVQVQMAVCGLKSTYFAQYKPAHITANKKAFLDITVVEYDPLWFKDNLPIMKDFFDEYMEKQKTFVPTPLPPPPACSIVDSLYTEPESPLESLREKCRMLDNLDTLSTHLNNISVQST